MDNTIKHYVESCDPCQRKDKPHQTQYLQPVPVVAPWHCVGIDIMGPLPKTADGYRYIVVAIDYFTKWPEAAPLRDCKAKTVAKFIFKDIICRHGCPKELRSDRGSSFKNQLIQALCDDFDIRHVPVLPYRPQSNGLVERLNQTIGTALSKYTQKEVNRWNEFLDGILLGYRTNPQSSTKFTPAYLTFG